MCLDWLRKLAFFLEEKFSPASVTAKLAEYGCKEGGVRRAIVTWDCKPGVEEAAEAQGIEVWKLPDLMRAVAEEGRKGEHLFRRRHASNDHAIRAGYRRGLGGYTPLCPNSDIKTIPISDSIVGA